MPSTPDDLMRLLRLANLLAWEGTQSKGADASRLMTDANRAMWLLKRRAEKSNALPYVTDTDK